MSSSSTFTSRRGEIPCGDKELYLFLTDMRNFKTLIPSGVMTGWQATEDNCSFKADKLGKVTAELSEALPYSFVSYFAETFITGKVSASVTIDYISKDKSEITLSFSTRMNSFMKMMVGNSAGKYLDQIISMIEAYDGYDKIRGGTQSP